MTRDRNPAIRREARYRLPIQQVLRYHLRRHHRAKRGAERPSQGQRCWRDASFGRHRYWNDTGGNVALAYSSMRVAGAQGVCRAAFLRYLLCQILQFSSPSVKRNLRCWKPVELCIGTRAIAGAESTRKYCRAKLRNKKSVSFRSGTSRFPSWASLLAPDRLGIPDQNGTRGPSRAVTQRVQSGGGICGGQRPKSTNC